MPEKHTTNPNLDLLDCALKQGVPAIGRYLQHATGHVLHITTLQGCECYPRAGHILTAAELEIFRNIPSFTDQEYFYDKNHQQLTLRCSLSEDDGLLLSFATVTPADIPALVEQAAPAHLALLWYLRSQMTAQAQADRSLDTLLARVFQGNDVRVDALLSRHGLQLSPDQNYAVMVMQLPQDTTITLPELAQQMQEFCTEHSLPVIQPLTWQGMHLAILSGFIIFPAVFSVVGVAPDAGPGLVFVTLPEIFNSLFRSVPWLGYGFSLMFYVLLVLAALTSTISMHEEVTAFFVDRYGTSRRRAAVYMTATTIVLATLCSLSFGPLADFRPFFGRGFFDAFNDVTALWIMPLSGIVLSIFVGWRLPKSLVIEELTNHHTLHYPDWLFHGFFFLIRWVAPIAICLIFLNELLS